MLDGAAVHGRRPPARPTMRQVAARVGVSTKTVSRVLNGEPGVSPATAEQIRAAARDLGVRRTDLARNLRRGDRTETVGLVLKHSSTRFYDHLIEGVEEVADRHRALVITAGSRTEERERETLLALSSRRVDGLLIVPTGHDHAFLRPEQEAGTALVFVDRPPSGLDSDTVLADDAGGAHAATAHLLRHGHRRIGVLGASAQLHTVAERVRGHRAALASAGLPDDPALLALDLDGGAAARAATVRLLTAPDPPTALFALNGVCSVGATYALRDLRRHRQVALVGFDDVELADLLDPPVTVVQHDVTAMGRVAAELLFARIGGADAPAETIVLPTALVARGSGELSGPHPPAVVPARSADGVAGGTR